MLEWIKKIFGIDEVMPYMLPIHNKPKDDQLTAPAQPVDTSKMTLGQKQRHLTRMIADLIIFAYDNGYELTLGDAYRDPRVHGAVGKKSSYSSANSLHKERLAIDFNLFKNGQYLTQTEDHRLLGEYWESIGGTWGGRFNDGNHYSLEHNGRK